jgi:hypothetical protein
MEPVGSTYSQPWVSDSSAGWSAGQLLRTPAETAGPKVDDTGLRGVASGKTSEQKGLQPSEPSINDFRPYSRFSLQKSNETGDAKKPQSSSPSAGAAQEKQDPQVQAEIEQLKAIEEKVKAHEAAHKSAGGTLTGAVSYTYTRGPDGKSYITGGEVPISVSPGKTPQETIRRMQQVIQAALAPADPSPQDRAVAAQAAAQQQEASQKLAAASAPSTTDTPPTVSSEPQNQSDSIVARDSQRAYGNPEVSGQQPRTTAVEDSARQAARSADSPFYAAIQSSQATISPASITGFGAYQSVSYYA